MIQLRQLALRQGSHLLFEAAQIQIHAGQKVGIVGANGCGKSSLFALIRSELNPDQGEIEIPPHWQIAHVAQQTPSEPIAILDYVLSGDEELMRLEKAMNSAQGEDLAELHARYEQIGGYQARSRAAQLLHGLGFQAGDEQRLLTEFSGGWRMRLNLARALLCRSDLLLLDEPTNHLDLNAVIWLENWLLRYEGTLLLISHDREFLDRIVNHILHFEGRNLHWYKGNYSSFEKIRAARLAQQTAAYRQQQKQIQHIQSYIQRFRAKASKAKQAQSRLKTLQKLEQIAPAHIDSPFRFHFFRPEKIPHPLLRLEEVSTGYDGPLLQNINISLVPGDRIGLLGFNGAGKSTLIKLLAGELPVLSGILEQAPDLSIGYFAQHQLEQLQPDHSPLQHLLQLDPQADEQSLRRYLGHFGFSGDQALAAIAPFSGGEKARLVLALIIYQRPNLLLLDEPTNHLDLEMRQALVMALQNYEGAMVIVSHDRYLLKACVDQLWLVHQGQVKPFEQSLEDYSAWLQAQQEGNKPRKSSTKHQQRRLAAQQRQKLQPLKKKLQQLEQDLEQIQQNLADLEIELGKPQLYQDPTQLKALMQQKKRLEAEAESLEMAWLDAAEALEQAQQQLD